MHLDTAIWVQLSTALVGLACLGAIIYRMIVSSRESARENVPPPVHLNPWMRLRMALNPGRLRKKTWAMNQATVKQTYLMRHEFFHTVTWIPKLGSRVLNPFIVDVNYSYGFWYRYLVNGTVYWGAYRFFIRYGSREEASEKARTWLQKTITIRYDPNFVNDSEPC